MNNKNLFSTYFVIMSQMMFLAVLWLMAGFVHRLWLPFIPQGFLGMSFLFLLLLSRRLSLKYVEKAGQFLIGHMLLFFVPAVIQVIEYKDLLLSYGLGIITTVILGTLAVMFSVGFVVDKIYDYEMMKKNLKKENSSC